MKALLDGLQRVRPVPEEDDKLFYWDNDADCTECHGCNKRFSLLVRKHHCRMCGRCELRAAGCAFPAHGPAPFGSAARTTV